MPKVMCSPGGGGGGGGGKPCARVFCGCVCAQVCVCMHVCVVMQKNNTKCMFTCSIRDVKYRFRDAVVKVLYLFPAHS